MPNFLEINEFAVPVKDGGGEEAAEQFGHAGPAFDGSWISTRRALKRRWSFETPPLDALTATALRRLLLGEGHTWDFDDTTDWEYSSKGLVPDDTTGATRRTASPAPKYGAAYMGVTPNQQIEWQGGTEFTDAWTVMVWRSISAGAWVHYIVRDDGQKWVDGVRNDAAATPFLGVDAGGGIQLGDPGPAAAREDFDDFVAFPFRISAAMAVAFGTGTVAFGLLPRLTAGGIFVEDATVSVEGSDVRSRFVQHQSDTTGVWEGAGRQVGFTLVEV